jgi:hypothetical protein
MSCGAIGDFLAAEMDIAANRVDHARNCLQRAGLARPVGADQATISP